MISGIVGTVGSVVGFSGIAKAVVTVLSGIFMLVMGLNMLHMFPCLQKINFRMTKSIGQKLYSGKTRPLFGVVFSLCLRLKSVSQKFSCFRKSLSCAPF
ncbi:MAG TPA: sulfite exporter TauE/SafE family protein [Clostridiales bacterium]|nr:sulfite exporter TauE/SafE family protein [Clostridiales bacterium]